MTKQVLHARDPQSGQIVELDRVPGGYRIQGDDYVYSTYDAAVEAFLTPLVLRLPDGRTYDTRALINRATRSRTINIRACRKSKS